jgi:SPP1 family predicted phage head-tail adaptor
MSAGLRERPATGELRDRVEIRTRVTTDEDAGGRSALYMPIATIWARVTSLTPRQTTAMDGRAVTVTHTVVLRWRTDISAGDRLAFAGRVLEVVGAEDLNGRRAYLVVTCSETAMVG